MTATGPLPFKQSYKHPVDFHLMTVGDKDKVHLFGKIIVSVLHDVQLLLNKQQQIWGGIYIH